MTNKSFKNMSIKQIERLAKKNREASEKELNSEYKKRGVDKQAKISYTYVDRSEDVSFKDASHSDIFNEFKKRPHQN